MKLFALIFLLTAGCSTRLTTTSGENVSFHWERTRNGTITDRHYVCNSNGIASQWHIQRNGFRAYEIYGSAMVYSFGSLAEAEKWVEDNTSEDICGKHDYLQDTLPL